MKKFLFAFVLLAVVASCSSSDDSEPLSNTDNGGTTTDNDGGSEGSGRPAVDTAYFFTRDRNIYYSYDSLSIYVYVEVRVKMVDSSDYHISYYFAKRDLNNSIIWKRDALLYQYETPNGVYDATESLSYLCDNQYSLLVELTLNDYNGCHGGLLLVDAGCGSDIIYYEFPSDCTINGYDISQFNFWHYWSNIRYNEDYYLLCGNPFQDDGAEPNLYLIMDGKNGDIVEYGRTKVDIGSKNIDYSENGYVVGHYSSPRSANSNDTKITVYISGFYDNEEVSFVLMASGLTTEIFYPYNCEVESVEVSGTNIIYTLALATPPENSDYPAYSKAIVTVSLETKGITEWEGIY